MPKPEEPDTSPNLQLYEADPEASTPPQKAREVRHAIGATFLAPDRILPVVPGQTITEDTPIGVHLERLQPAEKASGAITATAGRTHKASKAVKLHLIPGETVNDKEKFDG